MAILTVTVNPALDISTEVDHVESGGKLRCAPPRFDAGGGGVNVTRAIGKLGGASRAFIAIDGATGDMLKDLLQREGVDPICFATGKLTRQSLSVYEQSSGEQYRFVLPGPDWDAGMADAMIAALTDALRNAVEPIRYVVASGSLPPGLPDGFYGDIAELAARHDARFVLDTSGAALSAIARGGGHPPYVWIMDQAEAEEIHGREIGGMDDLENFVRDLKRRNLAEIVVASLAEGGAVAISGSESVRVTPPKVDVLSKIGAGDSFVAGLVLKLANGAPLREACAYAVAAAASAVTTPATQLCDGPQADRYFEIILNGDDMIVSSNSG
jgi:6-phosphofructokinase 2